MKFYNCCSVGFASADSSICFYFVTITAPLLGIPAINIFKGGFKVFPSLSCCISVNIKYFATGWSIIPDTVFLYCYSYFVSLCASIFCLYGVSLWFTEIIGNIGSGCNTFSSMCYCRNQRCGFTPHCDCN